jgi:hypothetical protein
VPLRISGVVAFALRLRLEHHDHRHGLIRGRRRAEALEARGVLGDPGLYLALYALRRRHTDRHPCGGDGHDPGPRPAARAPRARLDDPVRRLRRDDHLGPADAVGSGLPAQRAGDRLAVRLWQGRRAAAAAHPVAGGLARLGARGAHGDAGGPDPGAAADPLSVRKSLDCGAASERGTAAGGAGRDAVRRVGAVRWHDLAAAGPGAGALGIPVPGLADRRRTDLRHAAVGGGTAPAVPALGAARVLCDCSGGMADQVLSECDASQLNRVINPRPHTTPSCCSRLNWSWIAQRSIILPRMTRNTAIELTVTCFPEGGMPRK